MSMTDEGAPEGGKPRQSLLRARALVLEAVHGEGSGAARPDQGTFSLEKSTLARQLASKIPAVRLDKDDWVSKLGADLWDEVFPVRLECRLWNLALELLSQGQSVILEWGHWARVERDEMRLGASPGCGSRGAIPPCASGGAHRAS